MTAPDMESIIAAALVQHARIPYGIGRQYLCACAEWNSLGGYYEPHKAHQASAVLAAITKAGTVEWGVRYESAYGKTEVVDHLTEAQARDHYLVTRRVGLPPGEVVSRITGPWAEVAS